MDRSWHTQWPECNKPTTIYEQFQIFIILFMYMCVDGG